MNLFSSYILYTYRNSIGDIEAPVYSYWIAEAETKPVLGWSMIYLIWFVWFLNQWINLIIMLNFLIAIVNQCHEEM